MTDRKKQIEEAGFKWFTENGEKLVSANQAWTAAAQWADANPALRYCTKCRGTYHGGSTCHHLNPIHSGDDERDAEDFAIHWSEDPNEELRAFRLRDSGAKMRKELFLAGRKGMVPASEVACSCNPLLSSPCPCRSAGGKDVKQRVAEAVKAERERVANDALKTMAAMVIAYPAERQRLEGEFYAKYFGPESGAE